MEASVVIPSYRRPDFLARTLESCFAQVGAAFPWEIVVVDNDPAGSALAVAEAAASRSKVPLRYLLEARPGISYARNAGVAAATGHYLVFLDDDEEARPGWLAAFVTTMRATGADVAVGPVRPRFDGTAVDPFARRLFTREAGVASGTPLPRWSGIGNAILVRERCFAGGAQPFDPQLGLSGGEDAVFLGRLVRRGGTIVWCEEAGVEETIPASRLSPSYLLRRSFRGGQTTTFIHGAVTPRETGAILRWMAIGAAQAALYGPAGMALRVFGRPGWLPVLAKAASGLGKLLWHPRLHLILYR